MTGDWRFTAQPFRRIVCDDAERGFWRMTDRELAEAFGNLRMLCMNIIGFQSVSDYAGEHHRISEAERVMAEAQVYAGGVELARRVMQITYAFEDRT